MLARFFTKKYKSRTVLEAICLELHVLSDLCMWNAICSHIKHTITVTTYSSISLSSESNEKWDTSAYTGSPSETCTEDRFKV